MGMKLLIALAMVMSIGVAHADNRIVLESFTGGKSEAEAEQIKPLLDALASKGYVGGYDFVGRAFEARVSRPAIDGGLPADFEKKVEAGSKAFFGGKYEEAINTLAPLVDVARANSGAFAQNQGALGKLETAMIVLALSQQRNGDSGAMQTMFAELIRSFPDKKVERGIYGAEAVTQFEQAKKALAATGTGTLVVQSTVDTGVIYVNERVQQPGKLTLDKLPAGEYRVFVMLAGNQLSRVHRVNVRARDTSLVTIDAAYDRVVQTSQTWTGLAFANAADRERSEIEHASRFAGALDASAVAIVGIDTVRGKPMIVGALINRNRNADIRRASVALDPKPSQERLVALAVFLAGDGPAPEGIEVEIVSAPNVPIAPGPGPVDPGSEKRGWGGWKYLTGALALGALGVGGYLVAIDGTCPQDVQMGAQCPNLYNTGVPGYLSLGGGVALAGVTVYLFVRAGSKSKPSAAFVMPTRDGAVASFSLRF
jgi:hypothetical protein